MNSLSPNPSPDVTSDAAVYDQCHKPDGISVTEARQEPGLRSPDVQPEHKAKITRDITLPATHPSKAFNVTFNWAQVPVDNFGKHIELILGIFMDLGLSKPEQAGVEYTLQAYNDNVIALQTNTLPDHSVLSEFVYGDLAKETKHFPKSLQNELNMLSLHFRILQASEFYNFALLDKELMADLKAFIQEQKDPRVEELMAGSGWLNKSLTELGVDVVSSDNFSLRGIRTAFPEGLAKAFGIQEHYHLMRPVPGATVRQINAINALQESDRNIVLMCYPNPNPTYLRKLLDESKRTGKVVIHIAPDGESFDKLIPSEKSGSTFEVLKNAPVSKIKTQILEIGYWKDLPKPWQPVTPRAELPQ
ncbi:hypothetical protein [Endozoicomonas numazuensis]|uniref:Uncharacterized protein n=1 Tax=Endozoicomonas numazuensis TaxID=1137799 RepID=A0A081N3Y7_9GAMM|nr:hypothetical protein [Endozoicomonas numazuensis]KEQ13160.1 hypothetical protein GZ78_26830 [Endozoicomonas numazuensis]